MRDISWVTSRQNEIYTAVKVRAEKSLKTSYPSIRFTQDDSAQLDAQFPTVYVQYLPGRELASDTEADGINAFQSDVEVNTTVSKAQGKTAAFKVANAVAKEFKRYGYIFRMVPRLVPTGNEATKQVSFRMSRNIGEEDNL